MTSIPVRKGTTVNRRSGILKDVSGNVSKDVNSNEDQPKSDGRRRRSSKEKETRELPRPLTRQSSKKELWDENAKLKEDIHTHECRLKKMEAALNTTKCKLEEETTKSAASETSYKENLEEMVRKQEILESKLQTCEKKLLISNRDPVTQELIKSSTEEDEEILQCCEKAKDQVALLRDRLGLLNTKALEEIKCLKNMDADMDKINSYMMTSESATMVTSENKSQIHNKDKFFTD